MKQLPLKIIENNICLFVYIALIIKTQDYRILDPNPGSKHLSHGLLIGQCETRLPRVVSPPLHRCPSKSTTTFELPLQPNSQFP